MWSSLVRSPAAAAAAAFAAAAAPTPESDEGNHVDSSGGEEQEGGDGWDEEDANLSDSDSFEQKDSRQQQQSSTEKTTEVEEVLDSDINDASNSSGGRGGLFIGRLANFLDRVTRADHDEDSVNEGDDNDGVDGWGQESLGVSVSGSGEQEEREFSNLPHEVEPTLIAEELGWHDDVGINDTSLGLGSVGIETTSSHDVPFHFQRQETPPTDPSPETTPLAANASESAGHQVWAPSGIMDAATTCPDTPLVSNASSALVAPDLGGWEDDIDLNDFAAPEAVPATKENAESINDTAEPALPLPDETDEADKKASGDKNISELQLESDRMERKLKFGSSTISSLSAGLAASENEQLVVTEKHKRERLVDFIPRPVHSPGFANRAAFSPRDDTFFESPSLAVLAESDEDRTRDPDGVSGDEYRSSDRQNDETVYDDENEFEFGPVVDHTPADVRTTSTTTSSIGSENLASDSRLVILSKPTVFSRQNSLAVQAAPESVADDFDEDNVMDETVGDGWNDETDIDQSTHDGVDVQLSPKESAPTLTSSVDAVAVVVDQTPAQREAEQKRKKRRGSRAKMNGSADGEKYSGYHRGYNPSVDVLLSEGETGTVDDVADGREDMDEELHFGPVVDHIPGQDDAEDVPSLVSQEQASSHPSLRSGFVTATTNSLAVHAEALKEDYEQDEAMEESMYHFRGRGGDSTIGGTTLDDDGATDDSDDHNDVTDSNWAQDDDPLSLLDNDAGWGKEDALLDDPLYEGPSFDAGKTNISNYDGNNADGTASSGTRPVARTSSQSSEKDVVVDHIPQPPAKENTGDPSVRVLVADDDVTRDTGAGDDEEVYDDENEQEYGPVVDQLPHKTPVAQKVFSTRASTNSTVGVDSLAVHAFDLEEDFQQDNAMDDTHAGDSTIDGTGSAWDQDDPGIEDDRLVRDNGQAGIDARFLFGVGSGVNVAVVDHTPSEMGPRSARKARDLSVVALASVDETTKDDGDHASSDGRVAFGPVVDHTPHGPAVAKMSEVNSLAVNAGALEEDFQQDDAMEDETQYVGSTVLEGTGDDGTTEGWDQEEINFDEDTLITNKAEPLGPQPSHGETGTDVVLVDHTPSEMGSANRRKAKSLSVIVLVSEGLSSKGSSVENDIITEDVAAFGPVVDQTPEVSENKLLCASVDSHNAHASTLDDDFRDDDAMDETFAGGTSGDGWDQDDPILEEDIHGNEVMDKEAPPGHAELGVAVVDHTPSELGSKPSAAFLNSESGTTRETREGDNDSIDEEDKAFGPAVDQRPVIPVASLDTASDSVLAHAPDMDTFDDTLAGRSTLDAIGSTAEPAGSTSDTDDDSEADDEMPSALRSHHEDQVVDHVPQRPESRFGDASTLVAAEPSELLSEVDDMAQEEGNFGPVVDLTPPSRPPQAPLEVPSGAGSTVVFAPASVAADDLDDADETEVAGDENGWDHEDPIIEEAPNPQSGNDEPVTPRVNEQLVDFLPPQDEPPEHAEELSEGRESSSEVAVGGTQSLLQAEDPKEDDFGPVVDLTPAPRPSSVAPSGVSAASTATQLTASECRALEKQDSAEGPPEDISPPKEKVVVDHLPSVRDRHQVDSTGTIGQSQLTEDEEEDDSKFGPVVDHLPTPRASLAPSRGGSTVDALATVSEVDSDEDGGGWDEDGDFDVSEGAVSDKLPHQSTPAARFQFRRSLSPLSDHDRNVSVRFDSSVGEHPDTRATPSTDLNETKYFDAVTGETPLALNNNQYFDPDQSHGTGWVGNILISDSLKKVKLTAAKSGESDDSLADADTPPSTPYNRSASGNSKSTDDDLEEVKDRLPGTVRTCGACENATTIECPCIQKLLGGADEKGSLMGYLVTPEGDTLKIDFRELLQGEMVKRQLVEKECNALRSINEAREMEETRAAAKQCEIEREIFEVRMSNENLLKQVEELKLESNVLRTENSKLAENLNVSTARVCALEANEQKWSEREKSHKLQVQKLTIDLDTLVSKLDSSVAERTASIEAKLVSCKNECEHLQRSVSDLKQSLSLKEEQNVLLSGKLNDISEKTKFEIGQLQDKLQEYAAQIERDGVLREEIISLEAKHRELERSSAEKIDSFSRDRLASQIERDQMQETVLKLQKEINSLQMQQGDRVQHSELLTWKESEIADLKSELVSLKDALAMKEIESCNLSSSLSKATQDREAVTAQLAEAQKLYYSLEAQLEHTKLLAVKEEAKVQKRLEGMAALENELQTVRKERDILSGQLKDISEKTSIEIRQLESKLQDYTAQIEQYGKLRDEIISLEDKHRELERSSAEEIDSLSRDRLAMQRDRDQMQEKLLNLQKEMASMQMQQEKHREFERSSVEKIDSLSRDRLASHKERDQMEETLVSLQQEIASLQMQLADRETEHSELLARKQSEIMDIKSELVSLKVNLQNETTSLHKQLADREHERSEILSRKESEIMDLKSELLSLKDTLAAKEIERCNLSSSLTKAAQDREAVAIQLSEAQKLYKSLEAQLEHTKLLAAKEEAKIQKRLEGMAALENELESLRTDRDILSGKLQDISEERRIEIEQLEQKFLEYAAQIEEDGKLRDEMNTLEEKHRELERSSAENIDSLLRDRLTLEREREQMQETILNLREEISSLQMQLADREHQHSALLSTKESEIVDLKSELVSLEDALAMKESESCNLSSSLTKATQDREAVSMQLAEAQKLYNSLEAQLEHTKLLAVKEEAKIQNQLEGMAALENELKAVQEDRNKLEGQVKQLTSRIDQMNISLSERMAQCTEYSSKVACLEADLDTARNELDTALEDCSKLEQERKQLVSRVEEMGDSLSESREQCIEYSSKVARLENDLGIEAENLRGQVASLSKMLEDANLALADKERDFDIMLVELLNSKTPASDDQSATRSSSETGDITTLNSYIISLGTALERSEIRRAEAIDRLHTERQTNADSLRRLSESMKRYYSTVRFGDS